MPTSNGISTLYYFNNSLEQNIITVPTLKTHPLIDSNMAPQFNNNHITRVAIIGAGGRVGGAFATALLATGKHTVTAITREGSSSEFPNGVQVAKVNYDNEQSVVDALKGQEVLIITLSVTAPPDSQAQIISAAAKAGVPYIFPNEYGGDITNIKLGEETFMGPAKIKLRNQIEELGVSKWIAFCCSFWYEWSLAVKDGYGFDIKNREVVFYDDGNTVIDTSTWAQCGRAMAALLSLPVEGQGRTLDSFAFKPVFISSFRVSQKDMFESILKAGTSKREEWKIEYEPSKKRFEEAAAKVMTGDRQAFQKMLYSRGLYPDGSAFFGEKLQNDLFGLPQENFDELTKSVVDFAEAGKSWWMEKPRWDGK